MTSSAERLDPVALERLIAGGRLQMDHYGSGRLPFACVGASGLTQRFVELAGPDQGRLFDVLDASGGYGSACLGAGDEVVIGALQRAGEKVGYSTDEVFNQERSSLLAELFGDGGLFSEAFPGQDYHVSGRNSGSEGMELALRLVLESRFDRRRLRPVDGRQQRDLILAFEGAWHGWTSGLVPMLNRRHYRIGLPGFAATPDYGVTVEHLPFGDLDALREYLDSKGDRLLAVVLEPIQGDAGILRPPAEYLRELASLATGRGALVVADEVLTFAKTGRFFAMADERGPIPTDITVIGKSLGMGVLSTSMVIARRELTVRASGAVATSDLRPLSCAVMRDGLRRIVERNLLERSVITGELLRRRLHDELVTRFPQLYQQVRGTAFMQGVELTESAAGRLRVLREHIIRAGVYVEFMAGAGRRSNGLPYVYPTMRIAPPLITGPAEVELMVAGLSAGSQSFEAAVR